MRVYDVKIDDDEVVFGQGKQENFKVRVGQLADFCYLIETVYADVTINDDWTERNVTLDTAFLTPKSAGLVVPTARLTFNELGSFFSRRSSVMDKLLEGWRIDLRNVDYDSLADALGDFALVEKYNYTIPMIMSDGEYVRDKLEKDVLGTILKFNAAANGKGEKPSVYREDLYDDRDLKIESALVSKKAVECIQDKGTHRVIRFKPAYEHTGRGGNKIAVTVETPMDVTALQDVLGDDIPVSKPTGSAGSSLSV